MNEEYDDPFLPLPSLPAVESNLDQSELPSRRSDGDEMSSQQITDGNNYYSTNASTTRVQQPFAANFDTYSLDDDIMACDSDDCSDESDIDLGTDFDMSFEPTNIFNSDGVAKKQKSSPSNQGNNQEDSLSALPVLTSASSIKGYGPSIAAHSITTSEHGTSLSAASHNSAGNGDDAGVQGYAFYSRPASYNLKRPSYAMENNNPGFWDTQSAHSVHSSHSVTSTRSAPVLRYGISNSTRFQNPKTDVKFEHFTARTASSSCNESGIEASEKYSFYSRPQNYTIQRPAYAQDPPPESSHLFQYRVGSPMPSRDSSIFDPMPEATEPDINSVFDENQQEFISSNNSFSMPENKKKSKRCNNGRRGSFKLPRTSNLDRTIDRLSCKSMPASIPSAKVNLNLSSPSHDSSEDKDDENDEVEEIEDTSDNDNLGKEDSFEVPEKEVQQTTEGFKVKLVVESDRKLATAFSHAVLSEFGPTKFKETDRQGKRKGLKIGFPGMSCLHCNGTTKKGGRFFPSTIKTMADTKKTLMSINNHLMKCPYCPQEMKDNIAKLRHQHEEERKKQKYGSQKAFFSNIWKRLHGSE